MMEALGFWLFLAIIIAVSSWSKVRKRQMKNDLLMALIESGKEIDAALIEKMTNPKEKSPEESKADAQFAFGITFMPSGLVIMVAAATLFLRDGGIHYPLMGIGTVVFLLGIYVFSKMGVFSKHAKTKDSD